MKNLRILVFTAVLFSLLSSPVWASVQYRRNTEFGPMRMTYADFSKLIAKLQKYIRKANSTGLTAKSEEPAKTTSDKKTDVAGSTQAAAVDVSTPTEVKFESNDPVLTAKDASGFAETGSGHDSLTLITERTALILSDNFSKEAFDEVSDPSFSVHYSFQREGDPISRVVFNFGDFRREVEVEGTSREDVDALFGMLIYDLSRYESGLGGYAFRFYGAIFMIACGLVLVFGPFAKTRLDSILLRSIGTLLIVCVWLPWKDWMPGTALYSDEASFFKRNSAVIGVCLTICLPLLGRAFQLLYRHARHVDLATKRSSRY